MLSNRRLIAAAASALVWAAAGVALAAQDGGVEVTATKDQAGKLRWAPPALVNPTTIELGDGPTYTRLDDAQDYVIKLPATKKVGSTIIEGGHNVVIIGGYVTLPPQADQKDTARSTAIFIKDNVGTVHIEGVLIDASGRGMSDGIDISAPRSTVQIENVRVDGVFGFHDQFHAHVIKPFGGVAGLRVDKLTGYSGYQGLTLDTELGPIGYADVNRVNLVAIRKQVWGAGNNGGQMLWLTREPTCRETYPIHFGEVFVQPRAGIPLAKAVWPVAGSGTTCPANDRSNDAEVTFPSLPVDGEVERGMPPKGDFVPEGVAGVAYVSPGYQPTPPDSYAWMSRVMARVTPKTNVATCGGAECAPTRFGGGGR